MTVQTQQGRPAGNGTASKLNATSTPSLPAGIPDDQATGLIDGCAVVIVQTRRPYGPQEVDA